MILARVTTYFTRLCINFILILVREESESRITRDYPIADISLFITPPVNIFRQTQKWLDPFLNECFSENQGRAAFGDWYFFICVAFIHD